MKTVQALPVGHRGSEQWAEEGEVMGGGTAGGPSRGNLTQAPWRQRISAGTCLEYL